MSGSLYFPGKTALPNSQQVSMPSTYLKGGFSSIYKEGVITSGAVDCWLRSERVSAGSKARPRIAISGLIATTPNIDKACLGLYHACTDPEKVEVQWEFEIKRICIMPPLSRINSSYLLFTHSHFYLS